MRFENFRVLQSQLCFGITGQHRALTRKPPQGINQTLDFALWTCRERWSGYGFMCLVEAGTPDRDARSEGDAFQPRLSRETALGLSHGAPSGPRANEP